MDFLTVCYTLLAVCAVVVAFAIYKVITIQRAFNMAKECFSSGDGTLRLDRRGEIWNKFIKIKQAKNLQLGYETTKVHFGFATVGGVTTGGFYTTGGYNKIVSSTNSGKYELMFGNNETSSEGHTEPIVRIILTEKLYKEAENSAVAKYLNASSRSVEMHNKVYYSEVDKEILMNKVNKLVAGAPLTSGMSLDYTEGLPTYEKCKEVLDWICEK